MIGFCIGSFFSPLGSVLGAVAGYHLENKLKKKPSISGRARPNDSQHLHDDSLSAAYKILGASQSLTNEELKKAYRDIAKRCHPDALRSQGASEDVIVKASERMSRVNAAWNEIKKARGI